MRAWVSVAVALLVGTCLPCDAGGAHHRATTYQSADAKHHSEGDKHHSADTDNLSTSIHHHSAGAKRHSEGDKHQSTDTDNLSRSIHHHSAGAKHHSEGDKHHSKDTDNLSTSTHNHSAGAKHISEGDKHHSAGDKHHSGVDKHHSTDTDLNSKTADHDQSTSNHPPTVEPRALKPRIPARPPQIVSLNLDVGSDHLIRHINQVQKSWTAGRNFNLNTSSAYIATLMGVLPDAHTHRAPELKVDANLARARLPPFFDARNRWPRCVTIKEIHDQGSCGSCWAIAAVACINDRICIHNNGNPGPRLSAQDMLSCCTYCGFGCKGGFPDRAWQYYCKEGIPTGGWYGTREGCKPYSLPPCRHTDQGFGVACPGLVNTPACSKGCEAGSLTNRYYGRQYYSVRADAKYIMHEILNNGPVEASFEVYEDLLVYKSGVYHHVSGKLLGGHSVRLLGWGKEHDMEYWIAVNSWNSQWGERGTFKIRRGTDECGIEKFVIAGLPRT